MNSKIIAEAATCHGGSVDEAQQLIYTASKIGAHVIKFQLIDPPSMYIKTTRTANNITVPYTPFSVRTLEQLSFENWKYLYRYSRSLGIEFAFTFFDINSLVILEDVSVPFIKIASGDITHKILLKEISNTGLPVILSTGMSSEEDVTKALGLLNNKSITLMHCVSLYPCPIEFSHVSRIQNLKKFGLPIGYSDHTLGNESALLAHSLDVRVFEKHFRLNNSPKTADYDHSLCPEQFTNYMNVINYADELSSDSYMTQKVDSIYDLETKNRARRSYYFSQPLKKDTIIQNGHVKFVRPYSASGIAEIEDIIGRTVKENSFSDDLVTKDVLN